MHRSSTTSAAAVRPVTLSVAATVTSSTTAADTHPLTFHRSPFGGLSSDKVDLADPLGGIVSNASIDEMREILDVLNGNDTDAPRRAADEAAEKRRKHREAMVLFRLRKKMNFGDMKKQEQSLQEVLQHKLKEYRQLRDRRSSATSTKKHDDTAMRQLQDEFADILTVKESLLRENRAMEGVINELAKFQKLVVDEVDRQAEDDQSSSASVESSPTKPSQHSKVPLGAGRAGEWVQLLDDEPPVYYVPERDGDALAHDSFVRSTQLLDDFVAQRFDVTETFCLGWRAQHSLLWTPDQKRVLRFRFTRQVPRWFMTLDDYRRVAWPVVTSPELNGRLYSSPVHMKVLEWVNNDTFVTLRNSPHRDRSVKFRYFASNSQVECRDAQKRRTYMIHHTILDRTPLVQPTPESPIIWIKEGTQCMKFTEMEEHDAIEIDHFGYMNCVSEEQARYLMIETCSVLMRWEQVVIPPRLLRSD